MSDATDEPDIDPEEAEARLDELAQHLRKTRSQAEEHGTIPVADDGRIDGPVKPQGVIPPP